MAIIAAPNIRKCPRSYFRTRNAINSNDYECIIESGNTLFQRIGQTVPGLYEQFETTSLTYTVTNDLAGRDLDTWEGTGRTFRDMVGDVVHVSFRIWGYDIDVELTVIRRDSDGTETTLGTITASTDSTSLVEVEATDSTFTLNEVSESGSSANARAALIYSVQARHRANGTEARLQNWVIDEFYDATALIPTG